MAHRIIFQVLSTGSRIFGRAVSEAWTQASASQKYAAQAAKSGQPNGFASSGLTLDEACKILNVSAPKAGEANLEQVSERFKKLFDLNDPKKGGSFYLQSKVLRARERIELEVGTTKSTAEAEASAKAGWKPKMYK